MRILYGDTMEEKVLTAEHIFYKFDPEIKPALFVDEGEEIIIETHDCFSEQITDENQLVTQVDFSRVNPATGPIYVKNAEPGDTLVVKIKKIDLNKQGVVVTVPKEGFLSNLVKNAKTRICNVSNDYLELFGLKLPLRKMIGVIGVASKDKESTGTPGRHGGNMDTRYITEGSILYLPVNFPGGLFGLGDLHALMGDGELCVSGCEISGKVTLEFGLIKTKKVPWPIVEYGDKIYVVVSNENIDNALKEAAEIAVEALSKSLDLEWHDAYMLSSLTVDMEISQLVDPKKTVRAGIPKSLVNIEKFLNV